MKRWALLCVAALALCASDAALAWAGWGYYGSPFLPPYRGYSRESVPYFAENPPVYYSHVVPRPYGYSPYPYPPDVLTPDRNVVTQPAQPVIIRNPYVDEVVPAIEMKPRVQPKIIINPYVR